MGGKWDSRSKPKVLRNVEDKARQEFAGEGSFIELPINEIRVDFTQPRTSLQKLGVTPEEVIKFRELGDKEQEKNLSSETDKSAKLRAIVDLAKSIEAHGNISPITVVRDGLEKERPYVIETGGRRFLAMLYLGRNKLRAIYREDTHDSVKSRSRQIIENLNREDLSLSELLTGLENLAEAFTKKHDTAPRIVDYQKVLGANKTSAHRYLRLQECDQVVKDAVHGGELTAVRDIDVFHKFTTREQIDEFLSQKQAGAERAQPATNTKPAKPAVSEKPINLGKTVRPDVLTLIMQKVMPKAEYQSLTRNRDMGNPKELAKVWKQFLAKLEEGDDQ